jgi:hypothetical protein
MRVQALDNAIRYHERLAKCMLVMGNAIALMEVAATAQKIKSSIDG